MTLPAWRDWLFSIKTFAAAMLAVYIGLLTSLPRPYWAMATVYICSQPLSGATRSKSLFRVGGTLIGAVAAIVLVPTLANAPVLLSGALILWVGGCLFLSLLNRTPRSYTFMLGGYTAALIGFPAVNDPAGIWDLALARTEEIVLGITCASLVSSLVFPRSVGDAVSARVNTWLGDGARLARDAFTGRRDAAETRDDLTRLAGDAAEIDLLATHLAYDTSMQRDTAGALQALRLRMLLLLPILSSIADRIAALKALPPGIPADLQGVLDRLVAWVRPDGPARDPDERQRDAAEAEDLRSLLAQATPPLDAHSVWRTALSASLAARLREFIDVVDDCRQLRRSLAEGGRFPKSLRLAPEASVAALRHRDTGMALLSSLGVVLAMALCCGFWIESGWPDGSAAPMMAAVAACFFASQDDPVPSILQFANYTAVAVLVIAAYTFAIFPQIHDFEVLVLALAPFLVLTGVLIAMPKTMGKGLAIAANGSTILALQGTYAGDFQGYVNGNLALLGGMYAAAVVMRLVRSVGAEWAVRRLIRRGRRTIAAAAGTREAGNRARFAGLMLDRVGLLAPRLAALEGGHPLRVRDVLAHIRTGLNVIDLRRARTGLPPDVDGSVKALLKALTTAYDAGLDNPAESVLPRIDATLATLLQAPASAARDAAILAVTGIRRGLLPHAAPFLADRAPALEHAA